MITKKFNRRQARWAKFLAEFDFKIEYLLRKKNEKTDSLIRRSENRFSSKKNDKQKHMHQVLLSSKRFQDINDLEQNDELCLFDKIKTTNQNDDTCKQIRETLSKDEKNFDEMLLKNFHSIADVLFFENKLWVSKSNMLKLEIIRKIHDQSAIDHSNIRRTYEYVKKLFYWSCMRNIVEKYVKNCHICKRSKTIRDKYFDLLKSLSISEKSWRDISLNFVIELFINKRKNVILMMINRMTKMHHYISCFAEKENIFTKKTIKMLIENVWILHDLSEIIVFDRESQFISLIWKIFCKILKINAKLFIAFHSETDEQSEITNQEMKRYLRSYCTYQ